jgi:hydrogenase maturation protease
MSGRTLIAGIGNIFLADDGFGSAVAQRLLTVDLPEGVRAEDFGIRGVHLAYELLDGYSTVIMVDAVSYGEAPGTLFVIEPDLDGDGDSTPIDAHTMDPATVLALLSDLGGKVDRMVIVGCEPAEIEERMGLSEPVARAVDKAVALVQDLIQATPAEASPTPYAQKEH